MAPRVSFALGLAEVGGVLVSGTDTGVGKTVVSGVVVASALLLGNRVAYLKPVQTGLGDEGAAGEGRGDRAFVDAVARRLLDRGCPAGAEFHSDCLYELEEPLAPAIAASRAGVEIDFEAIAERFQKLSGEFDLVVVEGAGGLCVPLAGEVMIVDLATRLEVPVLLVARPGLGTLNHSRLSAEALTSRGIDAAGLVMSGWPDSPTVAEETNLASIEGFVGMPLLGVLPKCDWLETEGDSRESAAGRLGDEVALAWQQQG